MHACGTSAQQSVPRDRFLTLLNMQDPNMGHTEGIHNHDLLCPGLRLSRVAHLLD